MMASEIMATFVMAQENRDMLPDGSLQASRGSFGNVRCCWRQRGRR